MIKILVLILIGIVIGWYIPRPAIVDTVINKVKDDNIDQEYLDDSYDNVPFITKSKYLFKFW